jgi:hypothetical protein
MNKWYLDTVGRTHNLSIQEVLAHHDCIDRRRVVESKKRKTSGAASGVPHDGAGVYFAKLGEVFSERFWYNKLI